MKIIQFIDRVLWGARMASLTSPTYVGGYMPHDEDSRPAANSYAGEGRSTARDHEEVHLASV